MENTQAPAIHRLISHHGGVMAVARLIGNGFAYQKVQRWKSAGWTSPKHILLLEPLLLPGMTLHDLFADRESVQAKPEAEAA